MKKTFLLFLLLAVVVLSCNEDPKPTMRTVAITNGKWKYTKILSETKDQNGNVVFSTDVYSLLPACSKDDFTIFNRNNTYSMDNGLVKCNPDTPQIINAGGWKFIEADTKIFLTPNNVDPVTYWVDLANDTALHFRQEVKDSATGYTSTTVLWMKH